MFENLSEPPAENLLALMDAYRADTRLTKIDLGLGVYRDDHGNTPVFPVVKAAEERLVRTQCSKDYLGPGGDPAFVESLQSLLLGTGDITANRLVGIQAPGGTGALRLGADLLRIGASGPARIFVGTPTWPNHAPLFGAAGLDVRFFNYFDSVSGRLDFDELMGTCARAKPDDILLLHGCCHNPTGADFSPSQWSALIGQIAHRGLIPMIDLAYHGLGDGLEEDLAPTRALLNAVPEAFVALSCSKTFGLYRERTGALFVLGKTAKMAQRARANLIQIARTLYSMPPDHGAAAVRIILQDQEFAAEWRVQLRSMRNRIRSLRKGLAQHEVEGLRLGTLVDQRGMFAILPLQPCQIGQLRRDHAVYMADSGRINVAGLRENTIEQFVGALKSVCQK